LCYLYYIKLIRRGLVKEKHLLNAKLYIGKLYIGIIDRVKPNNPILPLHLQLISISYKLINFSTNYNRYEIINNNAFNNNL